MPYLRITTKIVRLRRLFTERINCDSHFPRKANKEQEKDEQRRIKRGGRYYLPQSDDLIAAETARMLVAFLSNESGKLDRDWLDGEIDRIH